MWVYDLIRRKRDGTALNEDEIRFLVEGYVSGRIPDYQMSAFLMAVWFRGMSPHETHALMQAMIESGEQLDLTDVPGIVVDKHSTGGVGDKTTLVLVPLVAAAGVPIMKMSGRGLGHTGGTLDKLESFPGYRTDLSLIEMVQQVKELGACIAGQTGDLTPADKKLYALRDATATVDSIPLIATSVMSKKLAAGADALVLDVKYGSGALMKSLDDAQELAKTMIDLARAAGKEAVALITAMDEPLGKAVGNALEVKEALAALSGKGPPDLVELVITLGVEMLLLSQRAKSREEAEERLRLALADGSGLNKFTEIVARQGGDTAAFDDPNRLPRAPVTFPVMADREGYVQKVDAFVIGNTVMQLGAGRAVQDAAIDPAVGIELAVKGGDLVKAGDLLATVHARTKEASERAAENVKHGIIIAGERPVRPPLIHSRLTTT